MTKLFDIAVFGATGFTGSLVASYISEHMPATLHVALAGRSHDKLEKLRRELPANSCDISLVIADVDDPASIDALAAHSRVLISTVGAFWTAGPMVVSACIKNGCHYLDSTGETHFIKKIIEEQHEAAVRNNVVVIPSCAFEAALPDLGAFLVARHLKAAGLETGAVKYSVVTLKAAGISGGTIHSLDTTLSLGKDVLYPIDSNPMCLEPADSTLSRSLTAQPARGCPMVFFDQDLGAWQTFFLPEPGNVRYARRSAALLGYGSGFSFHESLAHRNAVVAWIIGIGQALAVVLLKLAFIRRMIQRAIPIGSGPSTKKIQQGGLDVKIFGEATDKVHQCVGSIRYNKDPGYVGTAVLLAEAAAALVLDQRELRATESNREFPTLTGGVLTAASALGNTFISRLEKAGFEFRMASK